ncbi:MAG: YraN family protein [Chloroflexota bacterium]
MEQIPAPERVRTAAQRTGDAAEALVARTLEDAGWVVIARNVRVGRLEIDLVAVDPGPPAALVVVEVRWRSRRDFGLAEESVDHQKRGRLRRAASGLLEGGLLPDGSAIPRLSLRFDIVVVEPGEERGAPRIRHHRAAF